MPDCVLIQEERAHEIWRGVARADLIGRFTPDLIARMVDVPEGTVRTGYLWNGTQFSPPPSPVEPTPADLALPMSRDRRTIAICALLVRRRVGEATWQGFSPAQRRMAVTAELDLWRDLFATLPSDL